MKEVEKNLLLGINAKDKSVLDITINLLDNNHIKIYVTRLDIIYYGILTKFEKYDKYYFSTIKIDPNYKIKSGETIIKLNKSTESSVYSKEYLLINSIVVDKSIVNSEKLYILKYIYVGNYLFKTN